MYGPSDQTTSLWMSDVAPALFPRLNEALTADVCVVGAGIAGVTTAYQLAREGFSVVMLDGGTLGCIGQTLRTTAHLANAIDDRYFEIERVHGADGSRLTAESHSAAIDFIERVANEENIHCGFSRLNGYLFLAPQDDPDLLERELQAAHRAGLRDVYKTGAAMLGRCPLGPSLCFPRQGQVNIHEYLAGLLEKIQDLGVRVFQQSRVCSVHGGPSVTVQTHAGATVSAAAAVITTNTPINDRVVMHTKVAPYRTYVVALPVPAGVVEEALFWDTADAYHYVRLARMEGFDEQLLIVGGEDHKTGQAQDGAKRWAALERWTRERVPEAGEVTHRWSGQVIETIDNVAFIGRNPLDTENIYIATGDSGQGITHGTIAGMLITDLIARRPNPWEKLYDPSRKVLSAVGEYAKENLNVAAQYTDYLLRAGVDPDAIGPGEGGVVRRGLKRIAAYRDVEGSLHECSAVCPHLGCIVNWNPAENSWDCPCHGSRFTASGDVLDGPAADPLAPAPRQAPVEVVGSRRSE